MPARHRVLSIVRYFAVATLWTGSLWADELELLMFEQDGCPYCKRRHEEIGSVYPRTVEGAAAPLRQTDIRAPLPEDVMLTERHPVFTPTFVLLEDGTEAGRIEGYAGDEFFWVLLDRMLRQAGWSPRVANTEDVAASADSVPAAD